MYLNTFVAAGAEMVSYFVTSLVYDRIGIKIMNIAGYSIGLAGSIVFIIFGASYPDLVPVMLLPAAYGVSTGCMINWLSNVELFPVIYASSTIGICNIFCRLTNILAPQFAEFKQPIPMIIVAVTSILAIILTFFMDTTKDDDMIPENGKNERTAGH